VETARARFAVIIASCVVLWVSQPGDAYRLNGRQWAAGSDIVMELQLGSSSGTFIDGNTSWGTVAEHSLSQWNGVLGSVSFFVSRDSTASRAELNGRNNVFWDDEVFGEPFGDSTLATASTWSRAGVIIESNVVFNTAFSWDSYRGSRRSNLVDFKRVATHEFGHVLGLGHPDEHGQSVNAIMNSRVSDIDSLQTDDANGARAMYGSVAPTNSSPTVTASCSPCSVESGQTTSLRATATDADGDSLTYAWTITQGTLSNAGATRTTWTAPLQPTSVTATVTVDDGRGGTAQDTVTLQVVFLATLRSGARLLPGQSLTSTGEGYRLVYQSDGNLVLYAGATAQWTSSTADTGAGSAAMQSDGNFVVYDAQGTAQWFTGSAGNANASLVVQSDGNLVVYSSGGQAVWNRFSATAPAPTPTPTATPTPTPAPTPTCSYSVTPSVLKIGYSLKGTLRVTTTGSCSWKVTNAYGVAIDPWLTANPTSGTGSGSIAITGAQDPFPTGGSSGSSTLRIGNMGSADALSRVSMF
jgi:hypothetical protein